MGTEVTYSTFFCGVHPDDFESKLEDLEKTIQFIRDQIMVIGASDSLEYVTEFTELWEELEDAIKLRAYIWQAQEADDLEVSF